MNKFEDVFTKIINLSTEELCEVYYNLNGYRWDDRIGEKPEGFDDLPTWRNKWYHRFTRKTIGDAFHVGGSWLLFPKDTSLNPSPDQIINCRCSIIYL